MCVLNCPDWAGSLELCDTFMMFKLPGFSRICQADHTKMHSMLLSSLNSEFATFA